MSLISIVRLTPPVGLISMTWTAPLAFPPASSPGAPAAMSGTPSRLMSPTAATDLPNASSSSSAGPLAVPPLISAVPLTDPSAFMKMTCTAPLSSPPASSPGAPAAMSGTPSRSRSPTDAAWPNRSVSSSAGPLAVPPLISAVLLTDPSAFMNMTCRAPLPSPPASSLVPPARMSGTPSRSRSPATATESPNQSPADRDGPPGEPPSILTVLSTSPLPRGAAT